MGNNPTGIVGRIARSFRRSTLDGAARRFRGHQRDIVELLKRDRELAVELLVQRVQDKNEDATYRANIPLLLGKLGGEAAETACLHLLQDLAEQDPVRKSAVDAISEMGRAGESPFFDALVSCVHENGVSDRTNRAAAKALCRTGRPEVITHVGEYLFTSGAGHIEIVRALDDLDNQWTASDYARQLVHTLLSVYRQSDPKVTLHLPKWGLSQRTAVAYMKQIGDARFADTLREAVEGGQGPAPPHDPFHMLSHDAEAALRVIAERHVLREHLVFLDNLEIMREEERRRREQRGQAEEARKAQEEAHRAQQVTNLRREIRVRMKLHEIAAVLGPSSSQLGGDALLGMVGSLSGSPSATSSISQRQHHVWRRPEGEWKLVFVADELVEIYSAPEAGRA